MLHLRPILGTNILRTNILRDKYPWGQWTYWYSCCHWHVHSDRQLDRQPGQTARQGRHRQLDKQPGQTSRHERHRLPAKTDSQTIWIHVQSTAIAIAIAIWIRNTSGVHAGHAQNHELNKNTTNISCLHLVSWPKHEHHQHNRLAPSKLAKQEHQHHFRRLAPSEYTYTLQLHSRVHIGMYPYI